jgi:hypothetical protein
MPIDPHPLGLTEGLPTSTPEGRACVSDVKVGDALSNLGLVGEDFVEARTAVEQVLGRAANVEILEALATEAITAWQSTTPVRYFTDGDPESHALILAALAVLQPLTEDSLQGFGVSDDVITKTLETTGAQVRLFRSRTGALGVESGWWQIYGLMGGFIEVGELHAHRIELGTHQLGPDPWLSELHQTAKGHGFFQGDEAIGLHIPHGADLSEDALVTTFEAIEVEVQHRWPSERRRVLSIQTWMLDRQLQEHLDPQSRILTFQSLFEPLDLHAPNDELTRRLVFGSNSDPAKPTRLQRVLQQIWSDGGSSRWEVGIRLLDTPR